MTPTPSTEETSAIVPADKIHTAKGLTNRFVAKGAMANASFTLAGFEDKSLPPIIKAQDLAPGAVIIGKIIGLSAYTQDQIDSALITLDILDADESGELKPVGQRAAMPVGAVLARALGTKAEKTHPSNKQIEDIRNAGFFLEKPDGTTDGAIIAMRYNGTGKERGNNKAAPHLWDIKIKPIEGAVKFHSERKAEPVANKAKK